MFQVDVKIHIQRQRSYLQMHNDYAFVTFNIFNTTNYPIVGRFVTKSFKSVFENISDTATN